MELPGWAVQAHQNSGESLAQLASTERHHAAVLLLAISEIKASSGISAQLAVTPHEYSVDIFKVAMLQCG